MPPLKCIVHVSLMVSVIAVEVDSSSSTQHKEEPSKLKDTFGGVCKKVLASFYEDNLRGSGIGAKVSASANTLKVSYSVMPDQMVYNLRNKAGIDDSAKDAGFKRVVFADGSRYTLTVDLE